ncbi:cytochrome c3 family protein [Limisalsivibrio acetivorans]|uniref:cytochrome c3 family protein n=1 Tax=Limisalsivibrio acetivorans TaxID=1304888 RepID=UPI0003B7A342|nr:cytochrome c3 family protein [Limisalsivibrio acetivorans]
MKRVFVLLSIITIIFTTAAFSASKPDSSKECAVCHYEWMPEFLYDLKGTELVDYQKEKLVAADKMCFSCHNGTVEDSRVKVWSGDMHKLAEKIPEHMNIPERLPLDDGKLNCRTCHTPHATEDPTGEDINTSLFLRMENPNSELCKACHEDQTKKSGNHSMKKPEENEAAIRSMLEKTGGRMGKNGELICESCHANHSPGGEKILIEKLGNSAVCAVCHEDKIRYKDTEYVKGVLTHPVNVKHDDPAKVYEIKKLGGVYGEQHNLTCSTCHSAHKGKTDNLLIKKGADKTICLECHSEQEKVLDTPHNMEKIKNFRTKDGKTAAEKGVCESCHGPHGWSMELPAGDEDMLTKACLSCHSDQNLADDTYFNSRMFHHPIGDEIKDKQDKDYGDLPIFGLLDRFLSTILAKDSMEKDINCSTCHDVHSKEKNFLRQDTKNGELCITCHKEQRMIEKTLHGSKELDKSCLSCHQVHNSTNKRLLVKKEDDGCLDCHREGGSAEKMLIGEHSHPADVVPEDKLPEAFKLNEDGKFTCISCHNPHTPSKKETIDRDFLRGEYSDFDSFCSACHENQKDVAGTDHDIREKKTDPACQSCHAVHKAETEKYIMSIKYTYKEDKDYCNVCHREDGSGKKKIISGGHTTGVIEHPEGYEDMLTEHEGEYRLDCGTCHNVHKNGPAKGDEGDFRNSFLEDKLLQEKNPCIACHKDMKDFAETKHNPEKYEKKAGYEEILAEQNTCGACHSVHNSGYYLFDKKYGEDFDKICKSCHTEGETASETAINTSHKMNIEDEKASEHDLFLQNGKIVCSTCHEPHSADRGMLRESGDENLCFTCHADQKDSAFSEHNMARIEYIDEKTAKLAEQNACYVCHKPHNFNENTKLMWPFEVDEDKPFAERICTDCHNRNGLGEKKIPEIAEHSSIFKIFPFKVMIKDWLYDDMGEKSVNGSITCQTCHNPHVWNEQDKGTYPGNIDGDHKNSFLIQETRDNFCGICHGERSEELFNKYHDEKYRKERNKKLLEREVLQNMLIIQKNLQKLKEEKK